MTWRMLGTYVIALCYFFHLVFTFYFFLWFAQVTSELEEALEGIRGDLGRRRHLSRAEDEGDPRLPHVRRQDIQQQGGLIKKP